MVLLCTLVLGLITHGAFGQGKSVSSDNQIKILECIEVDSVPADFPVGFSSLSNDDWQFVAYYNKNRNLTVASRRVSESKWNYKVLPTKVGWDTHNRITMTMDRDLCLHVTGNMHNDSMTYFITKKALDISTFKKIFPLVSVKEELSCTYPKFLKTPDNQIIYSYRIGGSGNGITVSNIYDENTKSFTRLTDKPLFDGLGKMSAYASGPRLGPDGQYHVAWLWRNTPHCETNHSLSYARSKDLVHWENMPGTKSELPITPSTKLFTVDPVPPGGGAINGAYRLFFHVDNSPMLAYMKYDKNGNNQFFVAKAEKRTWTIKQVSNWNYRWEFSGPGSITFEIRLKNAQVINSNQMKIGYWHKNRGHGELIVDLKSLSLVEDNEVEIVEKSEYPEELILPVSSDKGLMVHWMKLKSKNQLSNEYYSFRWETMGKRRFYKPRKNAVKPSVLMLYKFSKAASLTASKKTIYISQETGVDVDNDGTIISSPIKTLDRAYEIASNSKNEYEEYEILLKGGETFTAFTPVEVSLYSNVIGKILEKNEF